jgi:hypothetical protein
MSSLIVTDRAWQYKLHEEMIFYQRINFFLIAESMLFVAFTTLLGSTANYREFLVVLALLGFLLGLVWLYVGARQLYVIDYVSRYCRETYAEYAQLKDRRYEPVFSSTKMLAYFVPVMVLIVWLWGIVLVVTEVARSAR